jgi:hypothetical protein
MLAANRGERMTAETLAGFSAWRMDWFWGLPLLMGTLLFHLAALRWLDRVVVHPAADQRRQHIVLRGAVAAMIVLVLTALIAFAAAVWAIAYVAVGALPDIHDAMLYSLSALTSYGHTPLMLERPWQMLGAIEALNGMMLLGITTAYLLRVLRVA